MQTSEGKTERLTMTVEEAGAALGISRATAYMLVNTGRLPAIRISDRRIIIPRKAISELLASASKQGSQHMARDIVFEDKIIRCCDCGESFKFSCGEQLYYRQKGLIEPRRCRPCREMRKKAVLHCEVRQ